MKMKRYVPLSLVPVLLGSPSPLLAGNIDSSTDPADTLSYTIGAICNRLESGAAGSQIAFTEPTADPAPTGCTLNEMMNKAPVADNTDGALLNEVLSGKTFWGLRTDGTWGQKTGTSTAADTSSGDATAADIASGKKAWVDGNEITGTASGGGSSAAVAKTGQTRSYETGDDGNLQKGVTWPNPRFTDNNSDGTVTDNLTGLIWLKNANCNNGQMTWTDALNFAKTLFDGSTTHNSGDCDLTDGSSAGDWRLPNYKELFSLIDAEYYSPALSNAAGTLKWVEGDAFSGVQTSNYWSSTTDADVTAYAWYVYLFNGFISTSVKSTTYYVWPVRGGM
jgi:hypothetical protein